MGGRQVTGGGTTGFTLPIFERIAPPPPPDIVVARMEAGTEPGEIVADPWGRGGWIARAAVDHQRRAFSLELGPLARMLADVVLRPPDLRHLDAAFAALGTAPRGETSLRPGILEAWSSRCATCGRSVILESVTWEARPGEAALPLARSYRCSVCRDQRGGGELRESPLDPADLERAGRVAGGAEARRHLRSRFPAPEGMEGLAEQLLALHTDRQLAGLAAILDQIEGELRAASIAAALRLAFIHAVGPASRLLGPTGRIGALRIAGGSVRPPNQDAWRERNPWLAFEVGYRTIRDFIQRLEGAAIGPIEARLGADLRDLGEGGASAVVALSSPDILAGLASGASRDRTSASRAGQARIRLVLGQPPGRPSLDHLAALVHATAWGLGRGAADLLPVAALAGPSGPTPWSWQSASIRRSLEALEPHMAREGRAVLLLEDGGEEALAAAALGAASAGWRVLDARLPGGAQPGVGHVELVPPGGVLPPGPRTRSGRPLEVVPGGAGDANVVAGRGRFGSPERIDGRSFSAAEAGRDVVEIAVEVIKARGEPVATGRLLEEILLGLDRAGQVYRLAVAGLTEDAPSSLGSPDAASPGSPKPSPGGPPAPPAPTETGAGSADRPTRAPVPVFGRFPIDEAQDRIGRSDPVDRLLELIHGQLANAAGRRLEQLGPGRWWLGDASDRAAAAVPLSDRLEWAVYGLLSTAGPISESALLDRVADRFVDHDVPELATVRAVIESYRHPGSTSELLTTDEDVRTRTAEHAELLALLANAGHRLGMSVWLGRRQHDRRIGSRLLIDYLDERERAAYLPGIVRAPASELEEIDCLWYVRGRAAIVFEVEWTAMIGDLLLRRHARIAPDPSLVRILAVPVERTELIRHRLERSPLLVRAIEDGGWQIVKWRHLRTWLARESLDLASLEPFLGLDPVVERGSEQLGLFELSGGVRPAGSATARRSLRDRAARESATPLRAPRERADHEPAPAEPAPTEQPPTEHTPTEHTPTQSGPPEHDRSRRSPA